MKKLDDIDKITDEINKLKPKKEKLMKLSDKSVKVTSIIKVIVLILVIIGAFIGGWFTHSADQSGREAYRDSIVRETTESLKVKQ